MKVKMIKEPGQPVADVNDDWGYRLIEQGKAIPVAESIHPQAVGKKKTGDA